MKSWWQSVATLLAVGVAVLIASCGRLESKPEAVDRTTKVEIYSTSAKARISHPEIGFENKARLHEHFVKHGREVGAQNEREYLVMAQTLRDAVHGSQYRDAVRRDGIFTRFNRASGTFIAVNPDLTIRTFFKPNDGEAYFERQLKK